ncbi:glycosyltransferase family 39 protein [Coleofasciculus sp. FACHB-1120]|uniref:glycosyltransferase family 39 protein n=1 Tax=Coleofasciculus sp. FACHB-1120 TaxID=2692783 RepID=UPI0016874F8A|nr:glycosyltransferase family 39 protein [Coleofasciculus sp. FACHB-1120]MBD2743740.1 glycosyltransferase family 39 protein [Coleofasciculus sp. FACHB-1120]
MNRLKFFLHYLALAGVIVLGAALRFWHLDLKPLWLDEVITGLFSLGRTYNDVPLDIVFPLSTLKQIFTLKPDVSCAEIAHTLATQSTHPPLFFCLMHGWLKLLSHEYGHGATVPLLLSTDLRSLPAIFGVGAIAAIYWLGRIAFFPAVGLMTAAIMAVSPFGVYLSQEARHYTLPVLLITLALVGFIQIQQDLEKNRQTGWRVWLGWGVVNSIAFYVHYFFVLAFVAQLVTLLTIFYWRRRSLKIHTWVGLSLTILGIVLSFLPWLPVLLGHSGRSETSWLPSPHNVAPLYQTLVGWLLMAIALPVESQPLWIAIPSGLLMLLFGCWLGWQIYNFFKGKTQLTASGGRTQVNPSRFKPLSYSAIFTLGSFTLCVLLQFLAIVYLLDKDITIAPRYHFVYYPALCALLGAMLTIGNAAKELPTENAQENFDGNARTQHKRQDRYLLLSPQSSVVLLVSLLSSVFVVSNLAFLKPFNPLQVSHHMNLEPTVPLMVVVGYHDSQDVALGLSFALAVEKIRAPRIGDFEPEDEKAYFAFLNAKPTYDALWQNLSAIQTPLESPLNLWVVAPGLKRVDYPQSLALAEPTSCTIDSTQHYRIGVPYQLYRCR